MIAAKRRTRHLPRSKPGRVTGRDTHSVTKKATPPKLVPRPKTAAERAARVRKIMKLLDEMYPGVKVPLLHRNLWELLVATILSAQCTDKRVNEVTPGLFRKYPTIADFAHANQAELGQDIRSTGFFNNKSKSLIGAAQKILTDFHGEVPRTMQDLLTVPGAARKTANVVLGGAFGIMEGVVVDTHVQRLSQRLDLDQAHAAGPDRAGPHEDHSYAKNGSPFRCSSSITAGRCASRASPSARSASWTRSAMPRTSTLAPKGCL